MGSLGTQYVKVRAWPYRLQVQFSIKVECKLRSKFYSAVSREHSAVLGSNFDCYCFGRKVSDCYTKIIMDMGIMFHQMRGADPTLPLAAEKRIIIHYLSKINVNCKNSKLHLKFLFTVIYEIRLNCNKWVNKKRWSIWDQKNICFVRRK